MEEEEDYLEPETIRRFYPGIDDLGVLKHLATSLVKNTAAPFVDFYVFENIVHIFNDIIPDVEKVEGCTPEQIWFAIEEIKNILGEYPDFDYEIDSYIKFIFNEEGYDFYHPVIEDQDTDKLEKIMNRAKGPYPIIEDGYIESQAIKLLRIQEYINVHRSIQRI